MVVCTGAIGALFAAQLPWPLIAAGMLLLILVAWRTLWPGHGRVVTLAARADGRWTVRYANGRSAIGLLQPDSVAHPWLCVVALRDGWRRVTVTIPADALTRDAHRRLRVRLRWPPRASARRAAFWSRQSPWPG